MFSLRLPAAQAGQKAIIYLHGFLGNHRNWRRIAQLMGDAYDHFLLDLPLHGQTQEVIEPSFQGVIDYTQTWLETLNYPGRIHLVGHSFGGRILMALSYDRLPRVRSVVIEDISPEPMTVYQKDTLARFFAEVPSSLPSKKAVHEFVTAYAFDPDVSLLLESHFRGSDPGDGFRFDLNAGALLQVLKNSDEVNLWDGYRRVSVRGMVIRGEHSQFLTPAMFRRMGEENSRMRLTLSQGTGHWAHIQDPQQFVNLLGQFYATLNEDEARSH